MEWNFIPADMRHEKPKVHTCKCESVKVHTSKPYILGQYFPTYFPLGFTPQTSVFRSLRIPVNKIHRTNNFIPPNKNYLGSVDGGSTDMVT